MNSTNLTIRQWWDENASRIRLAVKLIGPPPSRLADCRNAVETAIVDLAVGNGKVIRDFKPTKVAAARLASALKRVEHVLKNKDIDFIYSRFLTPIVREWRHRAEVDSNARATPEMRARRKSAEAKRLAIRAAIKLMHGYSSELKNDKRLHKLSAILYGKPNEDLSNQCRLEVRRLRQR